MGLDGPESIHQHISYHISAGKEITLRYLYRISICWEKLELNVLASPRQSRRVTSGKPTWNKDSALFINSITKTIREKVRSLLLCAFAYSIALAE